MSSHDEQKDGNTAKTVKRRRIGRACDMCRLKKIRCDGQQGPGQRCSNCATYDDECTFVQSAPKRQARPRGYVQRLEARVAAMEGLLARLCPASDLSRELDAFVAESIRFGTSDFDDSDFSDDEGGSEDDDSGTVSRRGSTSINPGGRGLGRANSKPRRDAFTYAIPPAFSPTSASSSSHHHPGLPMSPATSGLSSPTADSSSPSFSPEYERPSDAPHEEDPELESSDDEIKARQALSSLALDPNNVTSNRYFGKSSNILILKKALELKCAYAVHARADNNLQATLDNLSVEEKALRDKVRSFDAKLKTNVSARTGACYDPHKQRMRPLPCLCPAECPVHPWANATFQPQTTTALVFPEPDLMYKLISLYSTLYNAYVPVLHLPLFLAALADGLHLRDPEFGSVLLLVCALGARFSDDPRVLLPEADEEGIAKARWVDSSDDEDSQQDRQTARGQDSKPRSWHSAGWKWFRQVKIGRRALAVPPSLFDLQVACLASIYLRGSSAPEASRTITGLGLRLAQDLGAHRKKVYGKIPTEEQELLKRAFWALVWLDWSISPSLGRPCGIQYEDFDLDLPIECDDEYWVTSDPAQAFKQPPGKPAMISYFNCMLRLNQINAFAMRTIYSTAKSKALLGFVGPQWEQRIVAELDSALNAWIGSVPEHLRWDPKRSNSIYLTQSASLYAAYYTLQITIHRPFIPSPRKPSRTSFPSLAICTNAARSCVHVLDVIYRKTGSQVMHVNLIPLFTSTIVLMLNMWGSGSTANKHNMKEMEDIYKGMEILKSVETRWHTAGRLWDMLYELAIVGELPLPAHDLGPGYHTLLQPHFIQDRRGSASRASDSAITSRSVSRGQPRRGSVPHSTNIDWFGGVLPDGNDKLPVRSDELGKIPLHPIFDTDPTSSWAEYDFSPSVFNPAPQAPTPHQDAMTVDPALDSIFTAPRKSQEFKPPITPLPHIHAPQPVSSMIAPSPSSLLASSSGPSSQLPSPPVDTSPSFPAQTMAGPSAEAFSCDRDTLAMWSQAPVGFEWDDWGNYITNFNAMNTNGTSGDVVFAQPAPSFVPTDRVVDTVYTYYDNPM